MFRRFQFSLVSLLLLMFVCSAGAVLVGREIRHNQAVQRLEQLGGHVSFDSNARTVYLWRVDERTDFYAYVSDEEAAIRCLHQLKPFTTIHLLANQQHLERALRVAFPDVVIERSTGGVI